MIDTKSIAKWVLVLFVALATPAWGQTNLVDNPVRDNLIDAANSYIFVFDSSKVNALEVHGRAHAMTQQAGGKLRHVYKTALRGFSATMSFKAAEQLASRNPNIAYFEPNSVAWAIGRQQPNTNKKPSGGPGKGGSGGGDTTPPPPEITPPGIISVGGPVSGSTNRAWVIDTGIDSNHADLNVGQGANFVLRGKDTTKDGNGHGTHVAGTIAAIDNNIDVVGVAAGATVMPIRVLDNSGSGTLDGVIAGVDYVAQNASSGECANLSLGVAGHLQALHDAIWNAANDKGIKFSIAAGNNGQDMAVVENGIPINEFEPADVNHPNVFTVSAMDASNQFAWFSNYGIPNDSDGDGISDEGVNVNDIPWVDFVAPGVNILSTQKGGGVTILSGTSMAAPHVCGILTLGQDPVANVFVVNSWVDSNGNNMGDNKSYPVAHIAQ
jgi:subtilisin family serine protease